MVKPTNSGSSGARGGGVRWTTDEQVEWLTSQRTEYSEAQRQNRVASFLISATEEWLKKWPLEDLATLNKLKLVSVGFVMRYCAYQ